MRIGILTGGGDCPGLNAVIRAVVRKAIDAYGDQMIGFRDGWRGVLEGWLEELTIESTRGILPRGGTILGSSRTNPYAREDGVKRVRQTLEDFNLDGLIAIGGEDTLGVANRLNLDGINVIGVPKTIDNDLGGTDVTFGFDTALHIATEAIDRLHTTAESHNRILVVEVMGRTAGGFALHSVVAGGGGGRRGDPRPGDPVRYRRGRPADPPAARARSVLLDRGRRRGRDAQGGDDDRPDRLGRRVRAPSAGRDRVRARARDRGPDRV